MSSLPASFTSLYRLFLRASSASVLHHSAAKRALQKSWRPIFENAAFSIRSLQDAAPLERKAIEDWLFNWETRMDNTLSMFYSSASSRGLAHDLTRNLALLQRRHNHWASTRHNRPGTAWNPHLQEYFVLPNKKKMDETRIDDVAWNALGEVVRMAEGRDGLTLGRVNWKNKQRHRWR